MELIDLFGYPLPNCKNFVGIVFLCVVFILTFLHTMLLAQIQGQHTRSLAHTVSGGARCGAAAQIWPGWFGKPARPVSSEKPTKDKEWLAGRDTIRAGTLWVALCSTSPLGRHLMPWTQEKNNTWGWKSRVARKKGKMIKFRFVFDRLDALNWPCHFIFIERRDLAPYGIKTLIKSCENMIHNYLHKQNRPGLQNWPDLFPWVKFSPRS